MTDTPEQTVGHTAGPWAIDAGFLVIMKTGIGSPIYIMEVWDDAGQPVGIICGNPGEHEANLRLIAAAPDLLEALKLAEQWLSPVGVPTGVIATIHAAITKATS